MQEVFEKIIEKLEEDEKHTFDGCINKRYAIEIVKQEADKCKGGHFGCNTNGEHEKCNGCGLTYCKSRNKIWFGALDDGTDTNVVSNGWIPCSVELPPQPAEKPIFDNKPLELYLVSVNHADYPIRAFWNGKFFTDGWSKVDVNAWQPLPHPYQTKGE